MMTIDTAILAVLAVIMLASLILWQRRTSTHLNIIKNMQQQLQNLEQELKTLNDKIWEVSEEPRQPVTSESQGNPALPGGHLPNQEASPAGETPEPSDRLEEKLEQIAEAEIREGAFPEEQMPELELLELEPIEAEPEELVLTETGQEEPSETIEIGTDEEEPLETAAAQIDEEKTAEIAQVTTDSEEPHREETAEEPAEPGTDDLNSEIWSQLIEMAAQEEQPQGAGADDEKLIESDQAGAKPDPSGYNVGKSGKIYTEEELELLIKE